MAKAAAKAAAASKKKLTKSGLLTHLATGSDLTKAQVTKLYEMLVETITKELKKSGDVILPGLAKLKLKKVPAIKGGEKKVMPATGLEYTTKSKPAHNKVKAFPVKSLKDALA